jgi:uncharacterized protein YgiM (DUF1202 family)
MKKIAICVVLLLCLGAGSLFAQDVMSWPEPISPVHPIINLGVGFGGAWMYLGMGIPPLTATVDIPLNAGIPLSVGGGATFASFGGIVKTLYINGRVAMHLNFGVRGLDVYPVVSLGPYIIWWDWGRYIGTESWVGFGFGFAGGMRYFFNDNIGIYAEVGYATLSYITAGVTFTFGGGGGGSSSGSGNYYVNNDSLNVRSQPNADSAIVGVLKRGDRVTVLNSSGTWWEIRSGNIRGYVNSSYLARR